MLRSRLWSKKLPTSNAKFALKWLKKLRKNTLLYTKNRKRRGSSKKTFKYQYHPSITNIKYIMKSENISLFSFQPVSIDKKSLSRRRYTCEAYKNEWIHLFRINISQFQPISSQWWISSLFKIFKKEEKLDKTKYRPVGILPVISKIYERLMYD